MSAQHGGHQKMAVGALARREDLDKLRLHVAVESLLLALKIIILRLKLGDATVYGLLQFHMFVS